MPNELWPFRPLAGLVETLGFFTDALATREAEQRLALRPAPRQSFVMNHALKPQAYSRAKSFARRNGAVEIVAPVWPEASDLAADLTGAEIEILFDTADADYRAGGLAAIWESDEHAAAVEIGQVLADRLVLTAAIGAPFVRPSVAPARLARIGQAGLQTRRQTGLEREATIAVEAIDNIDLSGASPFPQYLGYDVVTTPPRRAEGLSETVVRTAEFVDNGFGPVAVEPIRAFADFRQTIAFLDDGKAALWSRRRWLHNLRGRAKRFFLPSFNADLKLTATLGAAATVATVASVAPTGFYVGRHVMIELRSGVRFFRQIVNAAAAGADDDLTLDAALGQAVAPGDVRWVSFLSLARFDQDAIEISYPYADKALLTAIVTEVPA